MFNLFKKQEEVKEEVIKEFYKCDCFCPNCFSEFIQIEIECGNWTVQKKCPYCKSTGLRHLNYKDSFISQNMV